MKYEEKIPITANNLSLPFHEESNPPSKAEAERFGLEENQPEWGLTWIGVPSLWKKGFTGENVKVAILDTGIAEEHPDLQDGCIVNGYNFIENNCDISDDSGHGTHVAGIVAARNNDEGYIGVAPGCNLLIGKVLDEKLRLSSADDLRRGIDWAVAAGADVINVSLVVLHNYQLLHEAIMRATDAGVTVVCAAGNTKNKREKLMWPAAYEETIAVGSIHVSKEVSDFSSRGKMLDIIAPGDPVNSTFTKPKYQVLRGTSMAAPFVSGLVALYIQKLGHRPNVPALKNIITRTAKDLKSDEIAERPDRVHGWGRINPEELWQYDL